MRPRVRVMDRTRTRVRVGVRVRITLNVFLWCAKPIFLRNVDTSFILHFSSSFLMHHVGDSIVLSSVMVANHRNALIRQQRLKRKWVRFGDELSGVSMAHITRVEVIQGT